MSSISWKRNQHINASHASRSSICCFVNPFRKNHTNTRTKSSAAKRHVYCLIFIVRLRVYPQTLSVHFLLSHPSKAEIRQRSAHHTVTLVWAGEDNAAGKKGRNDSTLQTPSIFMFVVWFDLLIDWLIDLLILICNWFDVLFGILRSCWINGIIIIIIRRIDILEKLYVVISLWTRGWFTCSTQFFWNGRMTLKKKIV